MAVPTPANTPPSLHIPDAVAGSKSNYPDVDSSPTSRREGLTHYDASEEYGRAEAVLVVRRGGTVR